MGLVTELDTQVDILAGIQMGTQADNIMEVEMIHRHPLMEVVVTTTPLMVEETTPLVAEVVAITLHLMETIRK
jgi:hypothetical protein